MSSMNSGQSSQNLILRKLPLIIVVQLLLEQEVKVMNIKMLVKAMLNRQMLERILKKEMRRILEVS